MKFAVFVCGRMFVSMEVASHQYSANGYFHNIGIDGADAYGNRGRWKLRRLSTIMAQLGHTGVQY